MLNQHDVKKCCLTVSGMLCVFGSIRMFRPEPLFDQQQLRKNGRGVFFGDRLLKGARDTGLGYVPLYPLPDSAERRASGAPFVF
jgi:hypothetical protein